MKKKLAIIGTGISAMTCAHYLRKDFDISIFEKNDYPGGHTHTHEIEDDGNKFTIDTGFIVFNLETYKNMLKMFDELGVEKRKSSMSFSIYNKNTNLQYAGTDLSTIFAQKKNIFSPQYWNFLLDIRKFFRVALLDHESIKGSNETITDYCLRHGMSEFFITNYLAPMSAAVWSTPQKEAHDFPIALLLPFFYNHGLLQANGQYQWYTVKGGSNTYTKKILANKEIDLHLKEPATSVVENKEGVTLRTEKGEYAFDYAILACHSDESLKIASNLPEKKADMLKKFGYNTSIALLHTDESVMPPIKKIWSSWNQVIEKGASEKSSTVYWVNKLQDIKSKNNYFISINPTDDVKEEKIIEKIEYQHPNFTVSNFEMQKNLQDLNEDTKIFFAGAYFGYGFHEDGVKAGLEVVKRLKK